MRKTIFAANEVVRLITGGPEMFVQGPGTADGQIWCTWRKGELYHGGSFDEKALIRATGKPREDAKKAKAR